MTNFHRFFRYPLSISSMLFAVVWNAFRIMEYKIQIRSGCRTNLKEWLNKPIRNMLHEQPKAAAFFEKVILHNEKPHKNTCAFCPYPARLKAGYTTLRKLPLPHRFANKKAPAKHLHRDPLFFICGRGHCRGAARPAGWGRPFSPLPHAAVLLRYFPCAPHRKRMPSGRSVPPWSEGGACPAAACPA